MGSMSNASSSCGVMVCGIAQLRYIDTNVDVCQHGGGMIEQTNRMETRGRDLREERDPVPRALSYTSAAATITLRFTRLAAHCTRTSNAATLSCHLASKQSGLTSMQHRCLRTSRRFHYLCSFHPCPASPSTCTQQSVHKMSFERIPFPVPSNTSYMRLHHRRYRTK